MFRKGPSSAQANYIGFRTYGDFIYENHKQNCYFISMFCNRRDLTFKKIEKQ